VTSSRAKLLLLLLLLAVAVRFPTMFGVKRGWWDEGAYVFFAQTLDKHGLLGIRQLVHDYPTDEKLRKSPLPLRIGFIVPAMLTCKALRGFDADNVAWLSFASAIGVVLVGTRLAENLADRKTSVLCAVLLITSPLAAGLSRYGTQDTFAALVMLAALYSFDQCWRRRCVVDLVMLGILICLALLTKESSLLLYVMMAIAGAYYLWGLKFRPSPSLILPLIVAPVIYLLIEIGICGGVGSFISTYRNYVFLQQTLDYTTHYEKGPWFVYLLDFLAIAPVVFLAGIVGFAVRTNNGVRDGQLLALIYFASGSLLFAQMPVVNVRIVLFADMFLRLGAAVAIGYLASRFAGNWSLRLLYLVTAIVALFDVAQFYQIFVRGSVYNPTTVTLLRADGFWKQ
jgi:4-amino-4-deoxy-L-arabinose transferase-like glycosyltransferase